MIPVFSPSHDHQEAAAVATCLASGWTGLGPKVAEFEAAFAQYVGVKYAVATNSCTSALHLAYRLLGVGPGDEVVVPALTFVSTALAAVYCGATPIFADSVADTLMIDPDHVRVLLTPKTKAVVYVLYGGQTIGNIHQFYCDGNIPVILDCAHACGSKQDLSLAPLHCWSFHSVKNLSCGDGGMLTMHSEEMYERAKRLRWCGIDTSTYDRGKTTSTGYKWEYNVDELGYKYHMNDITASIGLVQLAKMPSMQEKRITLVNNYMMKLPLDLIKYSIEPRMSANHLFTIRTDKRNELADYLRQHHINTGVHYKPIHFYPVFNKHRKQWPLPVVEREWQKLLTLPLYPDLTLAEVDVICSTIKDFYANH